MRSRLTRSFLLLEDDYDVDWEVDQDELGRGDHPHRAATARRGAADRRRRARAVRAQRGPRALTSRVRAGRPARSSQRLPGSPVGRRGERQRSAARLRSDRRTMAKRREPPVGGSRDLEKTGGVLLSQALASQVPSALRGLTALFGMGRGVSPSPKPPEKGERPRPPRSFKTAQRHNGYHSLFTRIKKIRQALDPLVPVSFERYRPSRSGLSTWWSTRGLTPSRGWESSS